MSISQTKLPGNEYIDLFPTSEGEFDFKFKSPSRLISDENAIKNTDLLLAEYVDILGKINTNKVSKDVVSLKSSNELIQQMLSYIKLYEAKYIGKITSTSDYSCQLVAAFLKDRYDIDNKRLVKNTFVENDYFGIISFEANKGNTLVAIDKNWILAAINKYITDELTYGMEDTVVLREKIATYNSGWDQDPFLGGQKLSINDLTIYSFQDNLMIFAPINKEEATKIYLYLYRDATFFTNTRYLTLKDVAINKIKDFEYLFPVNVDYLQNYVIFSTDQMTLEDLEHIYYFEEIPFKFPGLDDLIGAFATYLLAEKTFFQYSFRWEENTLYIGLCGYIQALDLLEIFKQTLNEVQKESPYYKELSNYVTAVEVASQTDSKCFRHNGIYYAALYKDITIPNVDNHNAEPTYPLMNINREYLQSLGYDTSSPEPYFNNLKLGFITYEIEGVISTVYHYSSTNRKEVDLHEVNGGNSENVRLRLELLLQKGFFFTQKVKNIIKGYPGFIPSNPPISRQLSKDPSILIKELDNLIRGYQ
jgi:hypothetical protein